jgi:hypothetical protein
MAGILSDIVTIEWGLQKLVLGKCDLDDLVCPLLVLRLVLMIAPYT